MWASLDRFLLRIMFSIEESFMTEIDLEVEKAPSGEIVDYDELCKSISDGIQDSVGSDPTLLLADSVDKLTSVLEENGQNFEVSHLVNEAFFLGFTLVVFCGLLALPVVTFIRVLRR